MRKNPIHLSRVAKKLLFLTISVLSFTSIKSQSSCPNPDDYSVTCSSGSGTCNSAIGDCNYTITFNTVFTGNKKFANILVYANNITVHEECVGPLPQGTLTYAVSFMASCNATISGSYIAYTNSSETNPCGGTTCETGNCSNGTCSPGILPISLSSFTGKSAEQGVVLKWVTNTEINNDYFVVEHSEDASTWQQIGKISGRGNSSDQIDYSFLHRNPHSGTNYYRLSQFDFDGRQEVFETIAVAKDRVQNTPTIITYDKNMEVISSFSEGGQITIYSINGAEVFSSNISEGVNHLNLEAIKAGIYVVRSTFGNHVSHKMIFVN